MKTYKVWVEIEEYDDETDEYSSNPGSLPIYLGEFKMLEEAQARADEVKVAFS